MGRRARPQRSIGGMAMVVTTAMVDDHGVEVLAQRAHREADGGDDHLGRAARIHGAAERQRLRASVKPPSTPPAKAPANLPTLAIATSPAVSSSEGRVLQDGEIGAQARQAEEDRHEEGR